MSKPAKPDKRKRPPRKVYGFPINDADDLALAARVDKVVERLNAPAQMARADRAKLIRMLVEQGIGLFENNPNRYWTYLTHPNPTRPIDDLLAE
jgi:hypothetical protein